MGFILISVLGAFQIATAMFIIYLLAREKLQFKSLYNYALISVLVVVMVLYTLAIFVNIKGRIDDQNDCKQFYIDLPDYQTPDYHNRSFSFLERCNFNQDYIKALKETRVDRTDNWEVITNG